MIYDIVAQLCHGDGAADCVNVVAIGLITRRNPGQKSLAVNIVAGHGVVFIGLYQELAGSLLIGGGYTVADGLQPVSGPVIVVSASPLDPIDPYSAKPAQCVEGIGCFPVTRIGEFRQIACLIIFVKYQKAVEIGD